MGVSWRTLVRGRPTQAQITRNEEKNKRGVCRIQKRCGNQSFETVGCGSLVNKIPQWSFEYSIITTSEVFRRLGTFDIKQYRVEFKKSKSKLETFELQDAVSGSILQDPASGLTVIPLNSYSTVFRHGPCKKKCSVLKHSHFKVKLSEDQRNQNEICHMVVNVSDRSFRVETHQLTSDSSGQLNCNLSRFASSTHIHVPLGAAILRRKDNEWSLIGILNPDSSNPGNFLPVWLSSEMLMALSQAGAQPVAQLGAQPEAQPGAQLGAQPMDDTLDCDNQTGPNSGAVLYVGVVVANAAVMDDLARCLDKEYRVLNNWKHMACNLKIPLDVQKEFEVYFELSPTEHLFTFLSTINREPVTVKKLRKALKDIYRNDLVNKLQEFKDTDMVDDVFENNPSLLDSIAIGLDSAKSKRWNWRSLSEKLISNGQLFKDFKAQLHYPSGNPTALLFRYLSKNTGFSQLTVRDLKEKLEKMPRKDVLKVLTEAEAQDCFLLTDVFHPDSDLLNKISTLLNKTSPSVKGWRYLAYKLGVPSKVYDEFEGNFPKRSPTKLMLEWLKNYCPKMTVDQLRSEVEKIARADALLILDGYFSNPKGKGEMYMASNGTKTGGPPAVQPEAGPADSETTGFPPVHRPEADTAHGRNQTGADTAHLTAGNGTRLGAQQEKDFKNLLQQIHQAAGKGFENLKRECASIQLSSLDLDERVDFRWMVVDETSQRLLPASRATRYVPLKTTEAGVPEEDPGVQSGGNAGDHTGNQPGPNTVAGSKKIYLEQTEEIVQGQSVYSKSRMPQRIIENTLEQEKEKSDVLKKDRQEMGLTDTKLDSLAWEASTSKMEFEKTAEQEKDFEVKKKAVQEMSLPPKIPEKLKQESMRSSVVTGRMPKQEEDMSITKTSVKETDLTDKTPGSLGQKNDGHVIVDSPVVQPTSSRLSTNVSDIPFRIHSKVCLKLNIKDEMHFKDFRILGELMGYDKDVMGNLAQRLNPTNELLKMWCSSNRQATVGRLIELLKDDDLGRMDVVEILENWMKEASK